MENIKALKSICSRVTIKNNRAILKLRHDEYICPRTYDSKGSKEIRLIAEHCRVNDLSISVDYNYDEEYGWNELIIS